ncbi:MAG TPA: DegT/DnrJ/EryC1/StrS family aminotransferase [Acidimicrobiia bacterium]|nr:DegT/DnrJ/EryC1/StrS family aminotransferase [Acidimicrobiia bacterium]
MVVGRPNLGGRDRLHRLLDEILDRAWLTNHGPIERELEERLREVLGTRHCIPVASATTGLMVALKALVSEGEVLMPSFTFPAAAHAARFVGLRPVFCDIEPDGHQVAPDDVAASVGDRTAALIGVHIWGRACDTLALERAMGARPVVYDAAHAFGAQHRGRPVGSNGRCEVFSFHATKVLNAFEGGCIATDDDDLAAELRLLINFGFTGRDQVEGVGINGKLSEIHAAMGLVSLDLLPEVVAANTAHLEQYRAGLAGLPGVRLVTELGDGNHSYVVAEIDGEDSGSGRDALAMRLRELGIDTRRYFYPGVHRMEPYASDPAARCLPITEAVCERVLQLPTGLATTDDDIDRVCRAVSAFVAGS